jgi:uncharacterized membrane protein YkoI
MKTTTMLALALSLGLVPRVAAAQQQAQRPSYEREIPAALLAQVKVGEDSARALALAKLPGSIEAVELLREHGKLVWVWDVKVAGKRGITEVSVDALDGTVTTHEE